MKLGIALIAAALLTASPLLAQTPPGAAQQKPAPVQPGQPAANPDATAPATPPVKLDPSRPRPQKPCALSPGTPCRHPRRLGSANPACEIGSRQRGSYPPLIGYNR